MSITTLNGTIEATELVGNSDDKTATLNTQAAAGAKDHGVFAYVRTLTSATVTSLRTMAFTPRDDYEVRHFAEANGIRALSSVSRDVQRPVIAAM